MNQEKNEVLFFQILLSISVTDDSFIQVISQYASVNFFSLLTIG